MVAEPIGFVWNLVAMSHHEEKVPKNKSHKQEEHKMVKKTSSSYELNSNDNPRIGWGKGGTMCANVVHSGGTSADTRIYVNAQKETV